VLLAGLLWKKKTMSQAVIAEHRGMNNAANASRVIHLMDLSRSEKKVSAKLAKLVSEKMKENEPFFCFICRRCGCNRGNSRCHLSRKSFIYNPRRFPRLGWNLPPTHHFDNKCPLISKRAQRGFAFHECLVKRIP
jgi:hypothetical protein